MKANPLVDVADRISELEQGLMAADAAFEHVEIGMLRKHGDDSASRDGRVIAVRWTLLRLTGDARQLVCEIEALLAKQRAEAGRP